MNHFPPIKKAGRELFSNSTRVLARIAFSSRGGNASQVMRRLLARHVTAGGDSSSRGRLHFNSRESRVRSRALWWWRAFISLTTAGVVLLPAVGTYSNFRSRRKRPRQRSLPFDVVVTLRPNATEVSPGANPHSSGVMTC